MHTREQFELCSEAVDTEARVVRGVVLCGNRSRNGYEYPESAFGGIEKAKTLYESRPVFIDHGPDSQRPTSRSAYDLAGNIRNVRMEGGKPRGDLHALKTEAGNLLLTLAQSGQSEVGLSHSALCRFAKDRGRKVVESVDEVVSVDVVVFPATTKNFSEQSKGVAEMDGVELLQDQLKEQKADYEVKLSELKESVAAEKAKVTAFESQVAELKKAKDELALKVDAFQVKEAIAERKSAVLAELKEAGIDPEDKLLASEAFIGILNGEEKSDVRKALIADRKALKESTSTGTQGRQSKAKAGEVPEYDRLKQLAEQAN